MTNTLSRPADSNVRLDFAAGTAEHEPAAASLQPPQRADEDADACRVDVGHADQIQDELTVALPVDDVGQAVVELLGVVQVERSVDVRHDAAKGTAERQ